MTTILFFGQLMDAWVDDDTYAFWLDLIGNITFRRALPAFYVLDE